MPDLISEIRDLLASLGLAPHRIDGLYIWVREVRSEEGKTDRDSTWQATDEWGK